MRDRILYKIEQTDYGFFLTFGGIVPREEMEQWLTDSRELFEKSAVPEKFYVFVDMRTLVPIDHKAKELMDLGQRLYREKGMQRSVVIVDSPVTIMQFRSIAGESGIAPWERYISSEITPDWQQAGLDWLLKGIDPELKAACKGS